MDCQPDGGLILIGMGNSMLLPRLYLQMITGNELHHLAIDIQFCAALEYQHPLIPVLVVPEFFWTTLAIRYDSFNTTAGAMEQSCEYFVFGVCG